MSVVIFTGHNYNGKKLSLDIGKYDNDYLRKHNFINNGNAKMSSYKIPKGLKMKIFSSNHFQGDSSSRTTDNESMDGKFGNNVKSIIVSSVKEKSIKIFTGHYYNGEKLSLGIGKYDNDYLRKHNFIKNGKARISSYKIPKGLIMKIFSSNDFQGDSSSRTTDNKSMDGKFGNNVKSIIVSSVEHFSSDNNNNYILILLIIGLVYYFYKNKSNY